MYAFCTLLAPDAAQWGQNCNVHLNNEELEWSGQWQWRLVKAIFCSTTSVTLATLNNSRTHCHVFSSVYVLFLSLEMCRQSRAFGLFIERVWHDWPIRSRIWKLQWCHTTCQQQWIIDISFVECEVMRRSSVPFLHNLPTLWQIFIANFVLMRTAQGWERYS